MNYLTEIKMFYDWLETHQLTADSVALWHALMQIASRSGWNKQLNIPLSTLESRACISRAAIYRERERLRKAGLIDFISRGGRACCTYIIRPFVSHSEKQIAVDSQFVSQYDKQIDGQDNLDSHFVSQIDKQNATIYKLNYTDSKKEIKENEVGAEAPPMPINPEEKKERKSCAKKKEKRESPLFEMNKWLEGLEPPWQGLMQTWLEYKRSRKERYKSEMSVGKCLAQLKRLSGGNPETAQQIIDQSIANNWAGLFELKRQPYYSRGAPPGANPRPAQG